MAIVHSVVVGSGDHGFATDWNDDHVLEDGSGIGSSNSMVVAAVDTTDKKDADYICDGVDDQDTINAAITALPFGGGRVLLLEGHYSLTASIALNKTHTFLHGEGTATVLTCSVDVPIIAITQSGCRVENLAVNGATTSRGIYITNTSALIRGCRIYSCKNYGVRVDSTDALVLGNFFASNLTDVYGATAEHLTVANNQMENATYYSIELATGTSYSVILGNRINGAYSGVQLASGSHNTVTGNVITDFTTMDGILMYQTSYCSITGNVISGGLGAQSDGIHMSNTGTGCDYNAVSSNVIEDNAARGVWVAGANCDKNIVTGNIILNNVTANFTDAGTATEAAHNIIA